MLETGAYWRLIKNDPFLYIVEDNAEFLDVDTELDFKVCETMYRLNPSLSGYNEYLMSVDRREHLATK